MPFPTIQVPGAYENWLASQNVSGQLYLQLDAVLLTSYKALVNSRGLFIDDYTQYLIKRAVTELADDRMITNNDAFPSRPPGTFTRDKNTAISALIRELADYSDDKYFHQTLEKLKGLL